MEIFKDIDFKLPLTPLDLAEHLIPLVDVCSELPSSLLHKTLIQVVSISYLKHELFYEKALKRFRNGLSELSMAREADLAALAGACLLATIACLGRLTSANIFSQMAYLVRVPVTVLSKLTARIIEIIFSD